VLSQTHSFTRQSVDVGSLDFLLPKTTDLSIANIIGQDEDDVGFRGLCCEGTLRYKDDNGSEDEKKNLHNVQEAFYPANM
jgi:hypothetical protein